ncbi:kinase-like domain-containing protein [Lasiosphaeria miniovina]|uniref:Kinase-like domain-containing protein n=1 Tax=Lasiosphaeria miniovina TaxID=1954250 RepID=A0AA40DRT0_9PEZI|nr:kinase-like domain-containing protein [Lasiosphaeria miniovina]KAK0713180.1 kinase-like domain-containing protein [Lasiosphaeria miniovina]
MALLPRGQPWPPIAPDVDFETIKEDLVQEIVTGNATIYGLNSRPSLVFKYQGTPREYELQKAAGDCAIQVRGRVLAQAGSNIYCYGFLMDRGLPINPLAPMTPQQRRDYVHQMVHQTELLHSKGIVHGDLKLGNMLIFGGIRFCDFADGRYVTEAEKKWAGNTTWYIESPNRHHRAEKLGCETVPPTKEDDLFGLGLSIWQLYTGKTPHEDLVWDSEALKTLGLNRQTVDVKQVKDDEVRNKIIELLRIGGAHIS